MANKSSRIRVLTECAIMVALATVLSMITLWDSPYGGSVTLLSMAPIILVSLRWGVKAGLAAGFAHSLIQLLQGLNNLAWIPTPLGIAVCVATDYLLPFTLLGLAGAFRNLPFTRDSRKNAVIAIALGALMVTLFRYACHVISGVTIWYSLDKEWYADDPTHIVNLYGPWMFSIIYSAFYMVPEILATTLGCAALAAVPGIRKT